LITIYVLTTTRVTANPQGRRFKGATYSTIDGNMRSSDKQKIKGNNNRRVNKSKGKTNASKKNDSTGKKDDDASKKTAAEKVAIVV